MLVLLCFLLPVLTDAVLPTGYLGMTAQQKQDLLWEQISANPYNTSYLPYNYLTNNGDSVFNDTRVFDPTFLTHPFTQSGDEMEMNRPKLVFPFGVSFKSEYVAYANSSYTGLFTTGGIGITRLSALLPFPAVVSIAAIKVLVDGQKSQSILMAANVTGRAGETIDFFDQPLPTAYPVDELTPAVLAQHQAFIYVADTLNPSPAERPLNAQNLGQVEPASVYKNGTNVTGPVIAPYLVRVFPGEVHAFINTRLGEDFRVKLLEADLNNKIVYYIQAQAQPGCEEWYNIGALYARSNAVASFYEDQTLFFPQASKRWTSQYGLNTTCSYETPLNNWDLPETTRTPITAPATNPTFAGTVSQPRQFFISPTTHSPNDNVTGMMPPPSVFGNMYPGGTSTRQLMGGMPPGYGRRKRRSLKPRWW